MSQATLYDLKEKCLKRNERMRDEIVSTKSLIMDPSVPGMMIIRGTNGLPDRSFLMHNRVFSQVPLVVPGIPGGYLKKLINGNDANPGLAAENFNYWAGLAEPREIMLRFENVDDGDSNNSVETIRACLPATWNKIPYDQSIEALINKFSDEKEVNVTRFDDTALVLDFVNAKLDYRADTSINVEVDDPIEWGMRFKDSDVGMGALEMSPYTRRLICLNGMTTTSAGAVIKISHSSKASSCIDEVMSNINQGIQMIDGYSSHIAEQINMSQGIKLKLGGEFNHPESALARIGRDELITKLEDKCVRAAWEVEGENIPNPSVYRLHNAFTRAGTHGDDLMPDQRLHLQGVGGRILELATLDYNWN